MIVLDASAALSGLLNAGPAREAVAHQRLQAPHLIDSEVAGALRRYVASGRIEASQGWSLLETWQGLGLTRYPLRALLPRIWQLRDNLSAYDAGYVALAEALGCSVLTADARLSRAPGIGCPITVVPR